MAFQLLVLLLRRVGPLGFRDSSWSFKISTLQSWVLLRNIYSVAIAQSPLENDWNRTDLGGMLLSCSRGVSELPGSGQQPQEMVWWLNLEWKGTAFRIRTGREKLCHFIFKHRNIHNFEKLWIFLFLKTNYTKFTYYKVCR